jgi:hypothetical protein
MTSAKLLSAVEPVIMYQRRRFRGGEGAPGTPRYEMGLQQKEDVLHRLVDIWATGEASSSLGFAAARLFDELDPLEKQKDQWLAEKNLFGRAALKAMASIHNEGIELLALKAKANPDTTRIAELEQNPMVRFVILDSLANVLCPACKLWNTGHGANMMREAVSLMGGYGITEDCPGFLGHKWMDAQLEATYEGPEAVQRLQLSVTMTNELFLTQFKQWIRDLRKLAGTDPMSGACALATAMELWHWTLLHMQTATDAEGNRLYHKTRQGVTFPLADALCWLLAARQFVLDVQELEAKGAGNPTVAEGLPGLVAFYNDLVHTQIARAAGEVGRVCAELVYGYRKHPEWTVESCRGCYSADELQALEGLIPGIDGSARTFADVAEPGQSHPDKAGPCFHAKGTDGFVRLRAQMDGCLAGARLAKDRASESLKRVMTREALDYPV